MTARIEQILIDAGDTPISTRELASTIAEFRADLHTAAIAARDAALAEVERLREALSACVSVQERVQADTYWRTPDRALWPNLCNATRKARAALGASHD